MFDFFFNSEKRMLKKILKNQEEIMAKIDDALAISAALTETVGRVETKINELKAGSNLDPQLDVVIAAVTDAKTRLDAAIA